MTELLPNNRTEVFYDVVCAICPVVLSCHLSCCQPFRCMATFNPFSTNLPLQYPRKTENRRFSDVFREYRSGTLVENGLSASLSSAANIGLIVLMNFSLELHLLLVPYSLTFFWPTFLLSQPLQTVAIVALLYLTPSIPWTTQLLCYAL